MNAAHTVLSARCRNLAVNVMRRSEDLRRRTAGLSDEWRSMDDYRTLAESAVFLAFATLGGDSEDPLAFDWEGRAAALVNRATVFLRRDLRAAGSDYGECRRAKHFGRLVTELSVAMDDGRPESRAVRERARDQLMGVSVLLQGLLKPRDWMLLELHYLKDRTCGDIAVILFGSRTKEPSVRVLLSRARQRARAALEAHYLTVQDALEEAFA